MTAERKKILLVLSHIVGWLVFLSLPGIFNPHKNGLSFQGFVADLLGVSRLANSFLLITVFYLNYYVAIPRQYLQHKYFGYSLSSAGFFVVFLVLNYLIMPRHLQPGHPGGAGYFGPSFNFFMLIIVYIFSFAMCAYEQWQTTRAQMLNTEISFLKAQINPHFLFNTLNSIYALTLIKSEKAPDAVVKLSGMMRYAVSEASESQVDLAKEVNYITNYIELQKLRITDKIVITFEVIGEAENKQIAPFLLIPFVENAFKYGVNSEENSDIWIKIEITDNELQMQIENNKVFVRKDKNYGTSLGIKNTKERLHLMYPEKHLLKIRDGKYDFSVSLYIQLK